MRRGGAAAPKLAGACALVGALAAGGACSLTTDVSGLTGGGGDGAPSASDASRADASTDARSDGAFADAGGSAYRAAVLADAPLSYWRLGETSGALAADETGANPGQYAGAVGLGAPGALAGDPNTAATFDGTASRVDVGTVLDFTARAPYTLEAWVKPSAADAVYRFVFSKDTSDANGREEYALWIQQAQIVEERYVSGTQRAAAATVPVDQWSHVVGVYDGATISLYVNGALADQTADTRALPSKPVVFHLGAQDATNDGVFEGTLDELAIYDHALAPDRIAAHYALGAGK